MVSIKLSSVCHKAWQSVDGLYGAARQGTCLCGPIACIGSDWHGIGVPARVSSYSDLPFGPWHASDSNNLFILHTGSFIDAYGRLMKLVRWTKVVSEGAPSHHCTSSAAHFDCWGMNRPQSVLGYIYFGDVPWMSVPIFLFSYCLMFFFVHSHWKLIWLICEENFVAHIGCIRKCFVDLNMTFCCQYESYLSFLRFENHSASNVIIL